MMGDGQGGAVEVKVGNGAVPQVLQQRKATSTSGQRQPCPPAPAIAAHLRLPRSPPLPAPALPPPAPPARACLWEENVRGCVRGRVSLLGRATYRDQQWPTHGHSGVRAVEQAGARTFNAPSACQPAHRRMQPQPDWPSPPPSLLRLHSLMPCTRGFSLEKAVTPPAMTASSPSSSTACITVSPLASISLRSSSGASSCGAGMYTEGPGAACGAASASGTTTGSAARLPPSMPATPRPSTRMCFR